MRVAYKYIQPVVRILTTRDIWVAGFQVRQMNFNNISGNITNIVKYSPEKSVPLLLASVITSDLSDVFPSSHYTYYFCALLLQVDRTHE